MNQVIGVGVFETIGDARQLVSGKHPRRQYGPWNGGETREGGATVGTSGKTQSFELEDLS